MEFGKVSWAQLWTAGHGCLISVGSERQGGLQAGERGARSQEPGMPRRQQLRGSSAI